MFVDFGTVEAPAAAKAVCLRKAYHLEADGTYRVSHAPLPAGEKLLVLVTGGKGVFRCGGREETLERDECFLFCPEGREFWYATVGENWSFWWFEFGGETPWQGKSLLIWDSLLPYLCSAALSALKRGRAQEASLLFGGLLAQAGLRRRGEKTHMYREEIFLRACRTVRQELAEVTVARLAETVGVSPRTLRDLFLEFAGCPPKQYILRVKMDTACYFLENTSKTMGEIGELLGFSSQFHFSRAFRESRGLPPGAWRAARGE